MKKFSMLFGFCALLCGASVSADVSGDPEKLPGWIVAYETDAAGTVTRGSLAKLVRVVEAGADTIVSSDQTGALATGGGGELVVIEDADHLFSNRGHADELGQVMLDWLETAR